MHQDDTSPLCLLCSSRSGTGDHDASAPTRAAAEQLAGPMGLAKNANATNETAEPHTPAGQILRAITPVRSPAPLALSHTSFESLHLVEASKRLVEAAQQYNASQPHTPGTGAAMAVHAAALSFNDVAACAPDDASISAARAVSQSALYADVISSRADAAQLVTVPAIVSKTRKRRSRIWACFRRSN